MAKAPDLELPGIKDVRPELGSYGVGLCNERFGNENGTRKVGLRAEIDTSPPFDSVKEAVTRFGGSGSWSPFYKGVANSNVTKLARKEHGILFYRNTVGSWHVMMGIGDTDIKRMEEQAAELEKDLIMKELETLDVLEELGTTKRIVEELKQQIQKEALRRVTCVDKQMSSPTIKDMNKESYSFNLNNCEQKMECRSPCSTDSSDFIMMELRQAKLNLGKTATGLGAIQTSVESLNKKIKKEKIFLGRASENLTSKFAGVLSLEEELKQERIKSCVFVNQDTSQSANQIKKVTTAKKAEVSKAMSVNSQKTSILKTADLRLFAARKMEEAARAAEAVGLAELKALSCNENPSRYKLPQQENVASFEVRSPPLTPKTEKAEGFAKKNIQLQNYEANIIKMSVLKRLKEVADEIRQSKQAIEEAMSKAELAYRKQSAVEEALCKWMREYDLERQSAYYTSKFSNFQFYPPDQLQGSPLNEAKYSNLVNHDSKPVLRSTTSMRDVLSKKQILPEEYIAARPMDGCVEKRKVALSQMLHELRKDSAFHTRVEKEGADQKQYFAQQRRKFGFIHISLPSTRASKKKLPE